MRRKAVPLCLCVVLLTLLLTGCWSRRELNDLAIAVALGIDREGDQFKVSAQVVSPGEVAHGSAKGAASGATAPVTMFTATGHTVLEALRKMTVTSPRQIYLSHIRILILGEQLAREGIAKSFDFASRYYEMRSNFFIVVAKGTTAENVLKITTSIEKIPANHLFSSLETSSRTWAPTAVVTLDILANALTAEGRNPVLSAIEVKGNQKLGKSLQNTQVIDSPVKLKYSGLAVFNKDKLVGWLNPTESKGYTYIHNDVKRTVGVIECPRGGEMAFEVVRSRSEVKGKVINGKPQVDVDIRLEQNIGEAQCQVDLTKQKSVDELNDISEQTVQNIVEASISKVQQTYKTDIFGFGEAIHFADPKTWKTLKENWNQRFVDLPVNVHVKVNTRRLGTVVDPILKEIKE